MTKQQALEKTVRKFTNLIDGKILSGVSVTAVISYYESLCAGIPDKAVMPKSGIMQNFIEDGIKDLEEDEDLY